MPTPILSQIFFTDSPERVFWQAGKSVAGIDGIEPAGAIVRRYAEAWRARATA